MKRLIVLFFCASIQFARAAEIKYPVSAIPEELKTGMYAVIREQSTQFDIYSLSKTDWTYHFAVTILNKKGEDQAQMIVPYDKWRSVDYFRGVAYDAEGKVIKRLKQADIYDRSAVSSGTLFDDNRVKIADLSQVVYPYTVEFEYKIHMKFLFFIPDFALYSDDEISIQNSTYLVSYPSNYKPRFKKLGVGDPTLKKEEDGRESVSWAFENIRPQKFERNGPDIQSVVPSIIAAPFQFSYGGYEGQMDTWQNFGKWQILLNEGRNILPDKTIAAVKAITHPLKTNEEKIKAVYEYLQSRTRYVGIQLGIGGFQPFEAKTVDEVGYGDCKALSNYTVALLQSIGIKGYYTWIYGGADNQMVFPDFVNNYFNHIVVAVPNGADTLWLECTSQTNPFGYSGKFTGERKALMITEDGGKLVNTPVYPDNGNIQSRRADVFVEKTGDANATVTTTYSGLQYENDKLDMYLTLSVEDQKKWVLQSTDIPSFDLKSFSMINRKDKIPSAIVKSDLLLRRFATVSGKRMFLTPNVMNRSTYVPEKLESRKTNIVRRTGFVDFDTVRYHLPEELYPEFLPNPVKIKSRFGEYEASFKLEQGKVIYTRKMAIKRGDFPADSYNEWIEFYKGVSKADNVKIVFLNKT